jgi:fatty acid kinase
MAHKIMTDVAHSPSDPRLGPATTPSEQDAVISETLERAVLAGQESVKRGPELLAALREAGVVDAGGYGLTIIFAGVVAALRGEDPPPLEHHAPARITHPEHTSGTYRFCTNFAVTGTDLRPGRFIAPLEALGDSVLVVGDENTLKIHLHTDDPERATAVFSGAGEVSRLDVADMRAQVAERDERLAAETVAGNGSRPAIGAVGIPSTLVAGARCGALAVVSGHGMHELFHELGVVTIDGGPTLNPSTYDLLAGIHAVPAEEVIVLTNSDNVVMASEQAARQSDKQVLVAHTRSQQAGLAAAVALSADLSVEENARLLGDALERVRSGAVAPAGRDDAQGRFRSGEAVGFVDEEVRAWGDPRETLRAIIAELVHAAPNGERAELLSVLAGEDAPLPLDAVASLLDGEVELELRHGGQQAYWWLLTAE